ncbi:MAG: Dabb family protein [Sedimentisphaerales bacterium]|nr:Dabb family protein [Sedimentisphaerales bacterium]MBN2842982.1 Dabb family protein [Sedimentisphaerales bacterium]
MLIHNVYFSLQDASEAKVLELITEAKKYLKNDPGLIHFAVGKRAQEFSRPVNDQSYEVCLNTVFKDKQAHDSYQVSKEHVEFVNRNKANFKSIRVCDIYAEE